MSKKKKTWKSTKVKDIPEPRGFLEGKYVVVFLAILGLAAGLVSWGYYVQLQRRPLEFWGTDGAQLLMRARNVAALRLVPADKVPPDMKALEIYRWGAPGSPRWAVIERRDISQTGGLGIMRQTLLNDNTYAWSEKADECEPVWQYALQFSEPEAQASEMLLVSLDCPRVRLLEKPDRGTVSIRPAAGALRTFLESLFKDDEEKN